MSVIDKAIEKIKLNIPRKILERAFKDDWDRWNFNSYYGSYQAPIEERIKSQVILKIVMDDLSDAGGKQINVPLDQAYMMQAEESGAVYRIPKSQTHNRSIVETKRILIPNSSYLSKVGTASACRGTAMDVALNQALGETIGLLPDDTTHVELIGENVIYVRWVNRLPGNMYLECKVAYSDEFHELRPAYYQDFYLFCIAAAKMYIYNTCYVEDDEGRLQGGQEFGRMQATIESYADASQNYNDLLNQVMRKVLIFSDDSMRRAAKVLQFGRVGR